MLDIIVDSGSGMPLIAMSAESQVTNHAFRAELTIPLCALLGPGRDCGDSSERTLYMTVMMSRLASLAAMARPPARTLAPAARKERNVLPELSPGS